MKRRKLSLKALEIAFSLWEGGQEELELIIKALERNKHRTALLTEFKKSINSDKFSSNLHRFQRKRLFLDAYYVQPTKEFRRLNESIDQLLMEQTPKSKIKISLKEMPDLVFKCIQSVFKTTHQVSKKVWQAPTATFVRLLSLGNLEAAMAQNSIHQENAFHASYGLSSEPLTTLATTPTMFEKPIRVCFSSDPNSGDQALTLSIMEKIKQELGFNQSNNIYEIIYEGDAKNKIKNLLGQSQLENQQNVKFINGDGLSSIPNLKPVYLSFEVTGADGSLCDPEFTNSKAFIQFIPYTYFIPQIHNTRIHTNNKPPFQVPESSMQFFHFPLPTLDDVKKLLVTERGAQIKATYPKIDTFIQVIENQDVDMMPVYGRTLRFSSKFNDESASPNNILMTLAGVQSAKLKMEREKPLVITKYGINSDYSKVIKKLIQEDNWGNYNYPGAALVKETLHKLNLREALIFGDFKDPNLDSVLNNLSPDKILFLNMGQHIPQSLFRAFFHHSGDNIWPKIFEGAVTGNDAINSGQPFFVCSEKANPYNNSLWFYGFNQLRNKKLKTELKKFYDPLHGYCGGDPNPNISSYTGWDHHVYESLANLIVKALEPDSSLANYFKVLQQESQNYGDRVESALNEVERMLKP